MIQNHTNIKHTVLYVMCYFKYNILLKYNINIELYYKYIHYHMKYKM